MLFRSRQNHSRPEEFRESNFTVVFNAFKEIQAPILNATFIIIVAFLPLFFLSGMEGRMLIPLGISFIVALFVSLIVARTLTPLLCNLLLTNERYLTRNVKEKWVSSVLGRIYSKSLRWALGHKRIMLS